MDDINLDINIYYIALNLTAYLDCCRVGAVLPKVYCRGLNNYQYYGSIVLVES